jgi:acyl transferase domain-containing protein/NADPH:quinone reductase-like Zn-dependent oxidoreductase/acyl carrier protein
MYREIVGGGGCAAGFGLRVRVVSWRVSRQRVFLRRSEDSALIRAGSHSNAAPIDVWIAGMACRLPGAGSVRQLWSLLTERRCAIREIGPERWIKARYHHPRPGEPGKAYTFRAGTIDDPWGFDAQAFAMSRREAEQIDPQQRLALEVTWESLEDAGIPPSEIAGTPVGVYVGTSSFDHGNRRVLDPSGGDAYYMTGSALSLVANRISYAFDLKGPSLVIDTACSSSLVALHQAMEAIRAGTIDAAVVASVNMLLSPFSFIGFSQARMLSPEGLCRAFGANGQGYVRSEGAVSVLLVRAGSAIAERCRPRARIVATGVNSDGRTIGVSLPSEAAQAGLIAEVHAAAGIDPDTLAFVEAHGTGTRAGDPIEARAIGTMLGRRRAAPLPIGSIKSNIGHLEPASGLAGLVKATLALEHDLLPATLHVDELNPDIDFAGLNLAVAREPVPLPARTTVRFAGISTFGFGGTNAHAILADVAVADDRGKPGIAPAPDRPPLGLLLSAHGEAALTAAADRLTGALEGETERAETARALVHHRELLPERAIALDGDAEALAALAAGRPHERLVRGRAIERRADVAFVLSGNGSQWAGMARQSLEHDRTFRRHIEAIASELDPLTGWSALDALVAPDLAERLVSTTVAQPLLLAIQAATVDALAEHGITPRFVIGHSVGEVAAAYAAGILDRAAAARVVVARSAAQEYARDAGRMAVLHVSETEAQAFIAGCGVPGIEIAAVNSPRSVTLVAGGDGLAKAMAVAERAGLGGQMLDIAYPFHSREMDGARLPLHRALRGLAPVAGRCRFLSTVTGAELSGESLDADYWWRNVREPVLFATAVARAWELSARVFLEIGPRPVLRGYLDQTLQAGRGSAAIEITFARPERPEGDTITRAAAGAIVRGAAFDATRAFGPRPAGGWRHLPHYAWQHLDLPPPTTPEALGGIEPEPDPSRSRRLLGFRSEPGSTTWHAHFDTTAFPALDDHRVAGKPWLAAAAFADIALSAATEWLGTADVDLADLEILRPLVLSPDHLTDVRTRIDPDTRALEIASRRRLSDDEWQVHLRTRFHTRPAGNSAPRPTSPPASQPGEGIEAEEVYRRARSVGLDYGPHFRPVTGIAGPAQDRLVVRLGGSPEPWPYASLVVPPDLDGAFQGLLALAGDSDPAARKALIPVRIGHLRLHAPGVSAAGAELTIVRRTPFAVVCDIVLTAADGAPIAEIAGARFAASLLVAPAEIERIAFHIGGLHRRTDAAESTARKSEPTPVGPPGERAAAVEEALLLLDAAAHRMAYDALAAGERGGGPTGTLLWDIAARAELVVETEGRRELVAECPLPPVEQIVSAIIAEHPAWVAECAVLADCADWLASAAAGRRPWRPNGATWQHLTNASPRSLAGSRHLRHLLDRHLAGWPADAPARILLLGADAVPLPCETLQALARTGRLDLVIADTDPDRLSAARAEWEGRPAATWLTLGADAATQLAERAPFDIVVALNLGGLRAETLLVAAASALAAGGGFIAVQPAPGAFLELVSGLAADPAAGDIVSPAHWQARLERAGFTDANVLPIPGLPGSLLLTATPAARSSASAKPNHESAPVSDPGARSRMIVVPGPGRPLLAKAVADHLGLTAVPADRAAPVPRPASGTTTAAEIIVVAGGDGDARLHGAQLQATAMALRGLLADPDRLPERLWLVLPGGARHHVGLGPAAPVSVGLWALGRTVTNESPGVDIRLVDLAADLDAEAAAQRLAGVLAAPGNESEIVLTANGLLALRVEAGLAPPAEAVAWRDGPERAARLELRRPGAVRSLTWEAAERRPPAPDEVEIEVAASGLNFRDVMWAMGLLPAEALEDGFAGATVGFECAGRIVRAGAAVADLSVGDSVIAMAPGALATHVTVTAGAVAKVPEGLDPAAATTVPVAFLTAYYALVHLGRLRAGERVLIHGGAGGVGLAALQIAQAVGAETFVTAGTAEKRALLRLLGADHVLSSRNLAFVDEIRATAPEGVDVVLNSLSGEAMELSLGLVRPFGRFLELGKRDFYENTRLGLRPFRRNVSYFGIDVDQLMRHDPALAREIMTTVAARLASGELRPLPYRPFEAEAVGSAIRLMQQAGHIGKIVVQPPSAATPIAPAAPRGFHVSGDGVHLVIGGTGGFGLATACWLADRGARRIVLVSRSGKVRDDARRTLDELVGRGVTVDIVACDVADETAVSDLLSRVRGEGHPIRSVFHSAMVIEDASLAQTSPEAFARVLAPKVEGARHLDVLTRSDPIEHFVLYSSATTLLGNPGQAGYVAANGYLEGLASRRRAEGLPGLAVAWGAIGDAGYLTRNERAAEILKSRAGVVALSAAEALGHLETLLAEDHGPVAVVAPTDWSVASRALVIARKPVLQALVGEVAAVAAGETGADVARLVATLDDAAAVELIAQHLARTIGAIMRAAPGSLDTRRPLVEMGIDSLMTVELRLAVEEQLGLELPISALAAGTTIEDLAQRMLQRLRQGRARETADGGIADLVAKHTAAAAE